MVKPRLLVTRFAPHAQRLTKLLNAQGIFALAQPLLADQKSSEFADAGLLLAKKYDFIIAVSRNAVTYTDRALAGNKWPASRYLAVGKGTQALLRDVTREAVEIPKDQFSSEGLLALPYLAQLQGKHVLILRGVGGRELLSEVLTARGAAVGYYQPYQRTAIELDGARLVAQWQRKKINAVIISSVELLQRLLDIVPEYDLSWLKSMTLYLPSQRIADYAAASGCIKVKLLSGMADQQVIDYFKQ